MNRDAAGRSSSYRSASTDAEGAYTVYIKPCKIAVQVYSVSGNYVVTPDVSSPEPKDVAADMTWPIVELEAAIIVEGTVVDAEGEPVEGAEIRASPLGPRSVPFFGDDMHSNAAGHFAIKRVQSGQKLNLRARTNQAASEPVNVTAGETSDPIRLVLNEKTSFALRGTVVDAEGKPIAGADVRPSYLFMFGNMGFGFRGNAVATAADGSFAIGGLWAGDRYSIEITAPGYGKNGSGNVVGTVGAVHDFGSIRLVRSDGVVEGRVIDSAGKPLADVRVFNSGDGPEPKETRSGAEGKFRLEGFFATTGPVYVFAEKEGRRFTAAQTAVGAKDAQVTMLLAGEPVPTPPPATTDRAAEEKAAARMLLESFRAGVSSDDFFGRLILALAARIDPALAEAWAKEAGIKFEPPLPAGLMQGIAEQDLDWALSLIAKDGARGYYALKDLAKHFLASDPEKAMRCAEEAVVQTRNLDQPARAVGIAEMGALVARLGNAEAGKKLALEAADMAAGWTPTRETQHSIGSIAAAVAVVDVDRALKLLEKFEKNERDAYVANVAAALDDLDKARSILAAVEPWYARRALRRLAYRIAAARPSEAVALIESAPAQGYSDEQDSKALSYGWLATVIAPNDAALAHSLIDRALAIYLHPTERSYSNYGGRPAKAAFLAVQAHEIGYPDMESVVWRVLAARPTTAQGESPVRMQEASTMMALYLAMVDPAAARHILQSLEPDSKTIGSGSSGVQREAWLWAWGLADPRHAVEVARLEISSAQDDAAKKTAVNKVLAMIDLWSTPAEKRLEYFSRRYYDLRPPDEE
jgi:protocatechuate 3,4-dioxygenase beta subunit